MDSSQEGAFNARKATLSLDLKAADGGPSLVSPAKSPLESALAVSNGMEITAAQKQYAQGFFDALRSVHNLNNFEFDNKKTALLSPGYVVPAIIGGTELASPFATTPTSNRELQAILQAMVGTPLGQPSTATHTGFPNALSSIIPGPSVSTAAPSTSVSNGSSEGTVGGLKMDIKQELSDDSNDTMSDTMSRSSSVVNSSNHGLGMSMDDQDRRKLERKRARNRAAASKCRQKKMDRIQDLETQVNSEKLRSQMLDGELMRLRTALTQLEHVMQRHRNQGCSNLAQQQQQQQQC